MIEHFIVDRESVIHDSVQAHLIVLVGLVVQWLGHWTCGFRLQVQFTAMRSTSWTTVTPYYTMWLTG